MRLSQRRTRVWTLALAVSMGLVVASAGSVFAGNKVDVCHVTGNGSVILLNVSENALQAHLNHGDALVGGDVPGMPGFIFDEECNPVEAVSCPCDFDLSTATAQNWGAEVYYVTRPGVPTGYGCFAMSTGVSSEIAVDSQNGNCSLRIEGVIDEVSTITNSSSAEAIQCAADLDAYILALVAQGVTIDRDLVNGEDVDCEVGVTNTP